VDDQYDRLHVALNRDTLFTAMFESIQARSSYIVINEINYNSAVDHDTEDWIELYNPGKVFVDLSGWSLKDNRDDHTFIFPDQTILPPDQYIIVCRDTTKFSIHFPDVPNTIGNCDFGLSGRGDQVRLFSQDRTLVDIVGFNDGPAWPTKPNGGGPTLELISPTLDNSVPVYWSPSYGHGTPGLRNQSPEHYFLSQNFPNPFNTSTVIRYDLPERSHVSIHIYDFRGRLVQRLVHSTQEKGPKTITWNATDLHGETVSTGVYFYQIKAGSFHEVRKCLVIR